MGGRFPVLSALPLWMSFGSATALGESQICYILDAILFLYGIILTVLYCRLKMVPVTGAGTEKPAKTEEGIYTGLTPHTADTYETIGQKKRLK
ncbi:high affinity immunoglobulin epsilon receptor subunit gamma isoform X2 [Salmo salar]|uniref:high affinity immunoglobulin epsilon receptor subunit gamma isoform X2 n=1 Tax=Salmo salar TaxID=8030 RepID=UPI000181F723|nr:high affinity immunoglobulin epsilon receptor subunit gamma isoform X2 [Salmo salar]XP_029609783.1 high affinity immunoglobulin epsilon receptor subunit gamma-like isoform X2 [Salmo trutta]ACI66690.1 High affinity immunoglobulin epsilon receptor subunit gamma precursor [Salmo salar]ACI68174.1 High affinity immunoglobulin epsilon receptor subunit gamma precursor [Salmo salar]ACI69827.1 High affinity immunoglobulin epsilon receptor subunit gamma precursor [Salmo salar]|eukprot:XP_014011455.1 PREDICTED: high affinity immunoglobulin epsilon receptor subunit gamma-like isoform X2 [Salmo salar]